MITYNEAKQLLNQGIFPCLITYVGEIDYIISYDDNRLLCFSYCGDYYSAKNENSELSFDVGGVKAK